MLRYTSGHKRRKSMIWTSERKSKSNRHFLWRLQENWRQATLVSNDKTIKSLVKHSDRIGHGAIVYQSISFDVASMIPAAQCSIFRAIHKANSATLASASHPSVSVWSAEAGGTNRRHTARICEPVCVETACKKQKEKKKEICSIHLLHTEWQKVKRPLVMEY